MFLRFKFKCPSFILAIEVFVSVLNYKIQNFFKINVFIKNEKEYE